MTCYLLHIHRMYFCSLCLLKGKEQYKVLNDMKLQEGDEKRDRSEAAAALVALGTSEAPSQAGDFFDDSEPAGNITSNSIGTQTDLNATDCMEEDNERIKPEVSVCGRDYPSQDEFKSSEKVLL